MRVRRSLLVVLLCSLLIITWLPVAAQEINGDKIVFGQSFTLESGDRLNGNLTVFAGDVTLRKGSHVRGDVALLGGSLNHMGSVGGSIAIFGGRVLLADESVVHGDLITIGGRVERAAGAVVGGDVMSGPRIPALPLAPKLNLSGADSLLDAAPFSHLGRFLAWELRTLGWCLLLTLLGLLAVSFAPRGMRRMSGCVSRETALSLAVGLLTLVISALVGPLLVLVCGLGLLVWLATAVAFLVGWLAAGLSLGRAILARLRVEHSTSLGEMAVGVFLLTFLARVPWCLGYLVTLTAGAIGVGAVVLTKFGTEDRPPTDSASVPAAYLAAPMAAGEHSSDQVPAAAAQDSGETLVAGEDSDPMEDNHSPNVPTAGADPEEEPQA